MAERFLYDAWGNPIRFHFDDLTDRVTLQKTQDCEPILEDNKRLQTEGDGYSPSRELRRVGRVPLNLISQMLQQDGISEPHYWQWPGWAQNRYLRKKLQDPDYRHLRTSSGGV